MNRILVINGPNLNLLGKRRVKIYGRKSYNDLCDYIDAYCLRNYGNHTKHSHVSIEYFQSNSEGEIINKLHASESRFDAVVLNAAAYTHYSYAIRDAIESIEIPVAEVHLTDLDERENFRKSSVIRSVCAFNVQGHGFLSYSKAIDKLIKILNP